VALLFFRKRLHYELRGVPQPVPTFASALALFGAAGLPGSRS
jgi:hypothetical protein